MIHFCNHRKQTQNDAYRRSQRQTAHNQKRKKKTKKKKKKKEVSITLFLTHLFLKKYKNRMLANLGCFIVTKEKLLRHQIYIVMRHKIFEYSFDSIGSWNHFSERVESFSFTHCSGLRGCLSSPAVAWNRDTWKSHSLSKSSEWVFFSVFFSPSFCRFTANAEPDIGARTWTRSSIAERVRLWKKQVVGKMPGTAVFLGLQFREYNEGEVNTKRTHKKKKKKKGGDLSSHINLRYFEGYTKSSILTLDVSQYLSSSPPCSLLPLMNHPWFERSRSERRDTGESRVISWDLTGRAVGRQIVGSPLPSDFYKQSIVITRNLTCHLNNTIEVGLCPPFAPRMTPHLHDYIQFD